MLLSHPDQGFSFRRWVEGWGLGVADLVFVVWGLVEFMVLDSRFGVWCLRFGACVWSLWYVIWARVGFSDRAEALVDLGGGKLWEGGGGERGGLSARACARQACM